jgi:hypothetical protein
MMAKGSWLSGLFYKDTNPVYVGSANTAGEKFMVKHFKPHEKMKYNKGMSTDTVNRRFISNNMR